MSQMRKSIVNLADKKPSDVGYIHTMPNSRNGNDYTTVITDIVMECGDFANLLMILKNATENDTVTLKLSSPGGSVETGIFICNAIMNTKAKVVTQAMGFNASIAAVIWCMGHEKQLTPTATLMFHMPSGFGFGKTANVEEESKYMQEYFKYLLTNITKDILTESEFDDMVNGRKDTFLPYRVLKNRMKKEG